MTISETYFYVCEKLAADYDPSEVKTVSAILLENLLSLPQKHPFKNDARVLQQDQYLLVDTAVKKLREGMPLQYVIGDALFYNYHFLVNESVLIPRPETEELVYLLLQSIGDKKTVLDVGTGSGCIAISIKKQKPAVLVSAVDISEAALKVAKTNAQILEVEINFICTDFLEADQTSILSAFDVIISNPPYIPLAEKKNMQRQVKDHEPGIALFVADEDPLIFYKCIADFAETHLNENGKIFLETHYDNAEAVSLLFAEGKYKTEVIKDMSGHQRFVIATRCQ